MIYESKYWKIPLLRSATWLERLHLNKDEGLAERQLARAERELLLGFYSIRKLLDTFKVTDRTKAMTFLVKSYKNKNNVDYFNRDNIDNLFDLSRETEESIKLRPLCDQFVHSYCFTIAEGNSNTIEGCFVCSDRYRQAKIYYINIGQIIQAFRTVGRDYPSTSELTRNPKSGQWDGSIS